MYNVEKHKEIFKRSTGIDTEGVIFFGRSTNNGGTPVKM